MNELKFKNQKGFTLIELMVSMFIGLIVFGGVFATFKNQKLLYARQETIIKMGQDTRAALNIMKSYIRRAGISLTDCSDTGTTKCSGLKTFVADTSFSVSADLNLDGSITATDSLSKTNESEVVQFLATSTLSNSGSTSLYICPKDNDTSNCQFILDNVKKFTIKGCETDSNGVTSCSTSPSDLSKVDSIEITLSAESKNNEITQNNQKIDGNEITARIFLINKTFQ